VTETLAARLTPAGTGAIATIALRGPSAWPIARELFRPGRDRGQPLPEDPEPGRIWPGRFGANAADDVILAVRHIEPFAWVEVHCHGGRQVVQLFLEALTQRGVRVCDAAEFHRLVLPADPLRESAEDCLLQAPTLRAAAILLGQRDGRFRVTLETILASLQQDAASAQSTLARLARFAPVGRHLVQPWQVTIAGAPNVGKSSLVNALAGYQRCIVSPTPGTTRDVVTTRIALDGWPVELADTAGLRDEPADLEGQGIARARVAAESANLCLWVLDATAEPAWPEAPRPDALFVVNKIDLPPVWDLGRAGDAVHVSACTGVGIPALCEAIVPRLVRVAPGPDDAVPFTPRLCDAVEEAYTHFQAGRTDEGRRVLVRLLEPGK
jgi:tRNA modification GTPase